MVLGILECHRYVELCACLWKTRGYPKFLPVPNFEALHKQEVKANFQLPGCVLKMCPYVHSPLAKTREFFWSQMFKEISVQSLADS